MEILINSLRRVLKLIDEKNNFFYVNILFLIIIFGLLILSTNGIETERFNNLILKKLIKRVVISN